MRRLLRYPLFRLLAGVTLFVLAAVAAYELIAGPHAECAVIPEDVGPCAYGDRVMFVYMFVPFFLPAVWVVAAVLYTIYRYNNQPRLPL